MYGGANGKSLPKFEFFLWLKMGWEAAFLSAPPLKNVSRNIKIYGF